MVQPLLFLTLAVPLLALLLPGGGRAAGLDPAVVEGCRSNCAGYAGMACQAVEKQGNQWKGRCFPSGAYAQGCDDVPAARACQACVERGDYACEQLRPNKPYNDMCRARIRKVCS